MREEGEGEEGSAKTFQDNSSPAVKPKSISLSFSQLDTKDSKILSLARGCPSTLANLSKKTRIPLDECMGRVRKLQQMGLIRELDGPDRPEDIHLYIATR